MVFFIYVVFIFLFIGLGKIAQILVKKGANVHVFADDKLSALIAAAYKGNISNSDR